MADHTEDELAAQKTAGFNVGEKKTLEEYKNLGKTFGNSLLPCGGGSPMFWNAGLELRIWRIPPPNAAMIMRGSRGFGSSLDIRSISYGD